jgi:hypothetical protein
MKRGKYIPLGIYNDVKIGYGTVDYVDMKSIYLKLNSWISPTIDKEFNLTISKTRKKIKDKFYHLNNKHFNTQSIVDLDIKTNGLKIEKKSFMSLEITLFVNNHFEIRKKDTRQMIGDIIKTVINDELNNKELFNFHPKKRKIAY